MINETNTIGINNRVNMLNKLLKYYKYYNTIIIINEFIQRDKIKTGMTEEALRAYKYAKGLKELNLIYEFLMLDPTLKEIEKCIILITNYIYSKCSEKPDNNLLKAKVFKALINYEFNFDKTKTSHRINKKNLSKINIYIKKLNNIPNTSSENKLKIIQNINSLLINEVYNYISKKYNISIEDFLMIYNYYFSKNEFKNEISEIQLTKMFNNFENIILFTDLTSKLNVNIDASKISQLELEILSKTIKSYFGNNKILDYLHEEEVYTKSNLKK